MDYESFAPANYQFVLFGMGFRSPPGRMEDRQAARVRQEFARIRAAAHRTVVALPPHRELLERVYQAGFGFSDTGRLPGASRQ